MDKYIEELRDLNLDLEGLKARKEAIKKKALEHRDSLTSEEQLAFRSEKEDIENKIKEIEERKAALAELRKNNYQGESSIMQEYLEKGIAVEDRDRIVSEFTKNRKVSVPVQEVRSVLLSSDGIAKPTKVNGIGDPSIRRSVFWIRSALST